MSDINLTVSIPEVPDRVAPDLPEALMGDLLEVLNSTTLSRFAAEETLDRDGIDGLYRMFVQRLVDNLTAWEASGDWPDRHRTAPELVAELAEDGELDLNDPADVRLLRRALRESGRSDQ